MRTTQLIALLAPVLAAGACNRDKPADTIPPELIDRAGTGEDAEESEGTPAGAEAAGEAEGQVKESAGDGDVALGADAYPSEVRAPVAEDLEHYVKDIEGTGPLVATLVTSLGNIRCELFETEAPMTVANFVGLARGLKPYRDPSSGKVKQGKFYDGLIFHRVIPEFMIQGGDPLGQGRGGPGYKFANETNPALQHVEGTLSMANAGPDTNGSQFFITEKAVPSLDGGYSVFGRCGNLDVVKTIARVPTDGSDRPVQSVVIQRIEFARTSL